MINLFRKTLKMNHQGLEYSVRNNKTDLQTNFDVFNQKYHRPDISIIDKNPVIVDLGSNIGLSIIDLKYLYPTALIIGVELDIDNFQLAMLNCQKLENVRLYNNAVWVNNEELTYNKNVPNDSYSINEAIVIEKKKYINKIQGITMDKLIESNMINKIDYLKMDIEGAEDAIFEGNTLWLEKVNYTKIEVHNGSNSMDFITKKLKNSGFKVRKYNIHWSTLIGERV